MTRSSEPKPVHLARVAEHAERGWFSEGAPETVEEALRDASRVAHDLPLPGSGATVALWEYLATLAAWDLGVARAVEPHLDACAIFAQAGYPRPEGTWGVFAAGGGPDPVRAERHGSEWTLSGEKPWCSLASQLDHALITADTNDGPRLFSVDLAASGVHVRPGVWAARGLAEIPSRPVRLDDVPATAVGAARWYLERDGFWWGGIGVAACWFGGAIGLVRTLQTASAVASDPHRNAHLGALDTLLHGCRLALRDAAETIDGHHEPHGPLLAHRVRGLVARTCEEVALRVGHALGPAPLALHEDHAKRVSDLQLYIRQHHAERDEAAQGAMLLGEDAPRW